MLNGDSIMQRRKLFIIIGIVATVIIVAGSALAYNIITTKPPPSEAELPDETIISNQKDLKEVKAFLNKYPNASMWVERSGSLEAYYQVDNSSKYPNATQEWDDKSGRYVVIDNNGTTIGDYRSLTLSVSVDDEGKPQEMWVQCWTPDSGPLIRENILNYIETETCLES
jgi:hypothetical protein